MTEVPPFFCWSRMTLAETSPEALQLLALVATLATALAVKFKWLAPVADLLKKLMPAKGETNPDTDDKQQPSALIEADERPTESEVARMLHWIEQAAGEPVDGMHPMRFGKFARQYANRMTVVESLQQFRSEHSKPQQEASE